MKRTQQARPGGAIKMQRCRAAQYLRVSTDMQDLSMATQHQAIQRYADSHRMVLVASYEDEGRSGLTIKSRPGIQRLLRDVSRNGCSFSVVLVYDVSRWGRFQDTDAAAYHEYHCRLHGVDVIYVQEPFPADKSPMGNVLKSLKRIMAAEYSRELGVKVRAGHARAMELGFQMGTAPSFGITRVAVSKSGTRTRVLGPEERKGIQSERIRWVPGPADEVALVRRVFQLYATTAISVRRLQELFAQEQVRLSDGRAITGAMLRTVLMCEAFVGDFVWGRTDYSGSQRRRGDEKNVKRAVGVMEPIIDRATWDLVQARLHRVAPPIRRSRQVLLGELASALATNPAITARELPAFGCASPAIYIREFGSFGEAVRLAGGDPALRRKTTAHDISKARQFAGKFTRDLQALLLRAGVACAPIPGSWQGVVIGQYWLRVQTMCPCRRRSGRVWRFTRRPWVALQELLLLVRVQQDNTVLDCLLLDRLAWERFPDWCADEPPAYVRRIHHMSELSALVHDIARSGFRCSPGLERKPERNGETEREPEHGPGNGHAASSGVPG